MHRHPDLMMSWDQARKLLLKNSLISKKQAKLMREWLRTDEPPAPLVEDAISQAWFLMVAPPVNRLQ